MGVFTPRGVWLWRQLSQSFVTRFGVRSIVQAALDNAGPTYPLLVQEAEWLVHRWVNAGELRGKFHGMKSLNYVCFDEHVSYSVRSKLCLKLPGFRVGEMIQQIKQQMFLTAD
jgi:hypothetical protein